MIDTQWVFVVVVQLLSHVPLFATPWTAAHQISLSFSISWSFLRFTYSELVMLSSHLILCHPLLLLSSIFSNFRVFSNELDLLIRWPKYWSFSISPSNEYSGLISFRIDWFDLLAVQKTSTQFLLKVHKPWRLLPEGNAHGAHSFHLLPLAEGWDDEWKLSVTHCFFSCLRALPPLPQPTGNVLGSLSTPGCNWNKLVARWRNLWNLLLMIYFRVESSACILKVVLR